MRGLVPRIHVFRAAAKTWMAGTSPAMTIPYDWNSPQRRSFDQVVGAGEQDFRQRQAKRLDGLEVDRKLELGRRLNRKLARIGAPEDATDVLRRAAEQVGDIDAIGHQAAVLYKKAIRIDGRNAQARRERNDEVPMDGRGVIRHHDQADVRLAR